MGCLLLCLLFSKLEAANAELVVHKCSGEWQLVFGESDFSLSCEGKLLEGI